MIDDHARFLGYSSVEKKNIILIIINRLARDRFYGYERIKTYTMCVRVLLLFNNIPIIITVIT